ANLTLPEHHAIYPQIMNAGNQFPSSFEKRYGVEEGEYSFARRSASSPVEVRAYAYGDGIVIPEIRVRRTFSCDDLSEVFSHFTSDARKFSAWAGRQLPRLSSLAFEVAEVGMLEHLKFPRRHSVIEVDFGESSADDSRMRMAEFLTNFRR